MLSQKGSSMCGPRSSVLKPDGEPVELRLTKIGL